MGELKNAEVLGLDPLGFPKTIGLPFSLMKHRTKVEQEGSR